MASRIAGITIKIGGDTSDLQKSLKQVDGTLRQTQSSLRDVNKLLKLDPTNTTLLTQKQKMLKAAVEETRERLKKLREAAANATPESLGEEKYDALQREIIETEDKLESLEKEYKNFGSVATQKIAAVGEKMKELGSKISSVGKTMTASVTLPIVAAFTVATKSASDYEENLNKIQVAFGDNADAVTEWANNAIEQFGLSKVAATDAVSSFGALGKGIGLTSDEAADVSVVLAGLSADLASYFNTGTDESAKALEGIFTGEAEALKKFGVVMTETNLKAFAEDQGLVYDELSATEKVMLRYNFVLEKTKDAQGDYSATSDGTSNSLKTFKAAVEDLSVAIGTQLLPIITPIVQKITEIIQKFSEMDPATQRVIVIIGLVAAALGPLLILIGSVISAIGTIMTMAPILGGVIAALSGPGAIVIAIIAAVIAAGVLLGRHWDEVCAWANNLKASVSNAFEGLKANVINKIQAAKNKVSSVFNAMRSDAVSKANALRSSVSNAFSGVANAISNKMASARNAVSNAISRIRSILSGTITFPHIITPHFHISGGVIPWGIGGKGTAPTVSVSWYKKAMNQPYLLDGATIFGAMGGKLLGGGESGKEVILSYDMLKKMGSSSVNINMTVNAAPGMNETELANMVARKINKQVRGLSAVW